MTIPLNDHMSEVISEKDLKIGNTTLTPNKISISFSKQVEKRSPVGFIGIDTNLENATCFDDTDRVSVIDMSKIVSIKMRYRDVMSHFTRNDVRIQKKLKIKYGQKQKNKEDAFLHEKSSKIVSSGRQIFLENLNGMRKLYRKGTSHSKRFRFRLNSWSRFKLHNMMDYKSRWRNGFPVIYVNPKGTSSKCSICGAKVLEESRDVSCPRCGLHIDRDVNAARNILARGMQFVPDALASEAMVQEPATGSTPESRCK